MSAEKPLTSQLVELLGISQATAWPPSTDELVIITIRPQQRSSQPLNLALRKAQVIRLLRDLESLLRAQATVLVACLALAAAGCSARVEVEQGSKTDATATDISSTEISRTTVALDLHPRPSPPKPTEPPPSPVAPEPRPMTIMGNSVVLNYRAGDVTYHSDIHVHVHEPARQETVVIRREVHFIPPRPIDPQCEQLRRQHEETVRRWKAFPLGE